MESRRLSYSTLDVRGFPMPPRFTDAVGFLHELRDAKQSPWFNHVCALALASTGSPPTTDQIGHLYALFMGVTPPPATPPVPARAAVATGPAPAAGPKFL